MNETPHNQNDEFAPPPPRDELDGLLREWHATNAAKAEAGRDRLMAALTREHGAAERDVLARIEPKPETRERERPLAMTRRIIVNRYFPLAAAAIVLAVLVPFMLTGKSGFVKETNAQMSNVVMAPEGGRLDAFDKDGQALGPCALKHTDVKAEISGRFTRVTVVQQYHNPNPDKIEAVYTFPLSDKAGVDRMTMTIGDRVIVGEVKERQQARRIYEQAKASNRVASLLEQERPNIFTQSIANIEPGATIDISISYVEMVAEHDGEFSFAFPTVVSPRYIPGGSEYQKRTVRDLPANAQLRRGLIFAAPATISKPELREASAGERSAEQLRTMLAAATPIDAPTDGAGLPGVWYEAMAAYPDGSAEPAVLLTDGRGTVGGRWFYCPPTPSAAPGSSFAQPTNQVPDADRITPMPTRPDVRAGHDISISVVMDTGGPGITFLDSPQHKVSRTDLVLNATDQPRRVSIALDKLATIPNRDFVLKWKQTADVISSRVFAHTGDSGNFFTVQLDAPAQVKDVRAVPRELVFVVDTSGSMNGKPIAICKEVMRKAIDEMRPQDTFNIITFAGATRIMWDRARPNTTANRDEAQRFIETWQGNGGTEMMAAIEAALRQRPTAGMGNALTPAQLADLPADGRRVAVEADDSVFRSEGLTKDAVTDRAELHIREGVSIKCSPFQLPTAYLKRANLTVADDSITLKLLMRGAWTTVNGERVFQVSSAEMSGDSSVRPLRLVMFLTDAEVGNDFAIIEAIKRNRDTTRVFSFGIGSSVNRYLIEQMALAGGGVPDFIYANEATEQQANAAVERFNRRTKTPILTDIRVTFNGVQPLDVLPEVASVQDLWDNRPLTFMGRYSAAGNGSLTIKGQTAQGPWERTIPIEFPAKQVENSSLPTLWARAKIDALIGSDLLGTQHGQPNPAVRAGVIQLGETFNVMSLYTSFVAVDKLRITVDGKPRLVHVPVEVPDQTNWEGFFGEMKDGEDERMLRRAMSLQVKEEAGEQRLKLKQELVDELVVREAAVRARVEAVKESEKLHAQMTDLMAAELIRKDADAVPPTPSASGPRGATGTDKGAAESLREEPAKPSAAPAAPAAVAGRPVGDRAKDEKKGSAGGGQAAGNMPADARASRPAVATAPAPAPVTGTGHVAPNARPGVRSVGTQSTPPSSGFGFQTRRQPTGPEPSGSTLADSPLDWPNKNYQRGLSAQETSAVKADLAALRQNGFGEPDGKVLRAYADRLAAHPGRAVTFSGEAAPSQDARAGSRYGMLPWSKQRAKMPGDLLDGYTDGDGTGWFYRLRITDSSKNVEQTTAADNLLTLAAAQLVEAGRLDDAKALLCPNVASGPSGKMARSVDDIASGTTGTAQATGAAGVAVSAPEQLCAAIGTVMPDAERMVAVRGARARAEAELLGLRRIEILARKLAPDVLIRTETGKKMGLDARQTTSDSAPKEVDRAAGTPVGSNTEKKDDGRLLVTILLSDTSEKTLESLRALGIKIVSVKAEASVVVASVSVEKVEELAMMGVVRRVELVVEEKKQE